MKAGKKAEVRAEKERDRRIATAMFTAFILLVAVFSAHFCYTSFNQPPSRTTNQKFIPPQAAIVDQLSLTFPNQTFIATASAILKQAGYTVDYYPGERVTVEFYRNLPTRGYDVVILRVHSLGVHSSATEVYETERPVALFTSESYSTTKYVYEQLTDQLVEVAFSREEVNQGCFGITPRFVARSMNGRFQNTVVIMMGCEGLDNPLMAKAFVEKGVRVYTGWLQPVSASHTDSATTQLLQHLFTERLTLEQAFRETFKEVGLDPTYRSLLTFYPLELGEQTVYSFNSES